MSLSSAGTAFKLQFAVSPIILTGGVASSIPGNALPFTSISSAINFVGGLLVPGSDTATLDNYFAIFQALPGGTLIEQDIGMYPFANQQTAANAVINKPLSISMLMICPAGTGGGYITKFANMQSIQQTLTQHNQSGGTYTIMTSAFPYTNCVMLAMTDISNSITHQQQNAYKLDFIQPLITLAQAAQAQNQLMSQISSQTPPSGLPNLAPGTSTVTPPGIQAGPTGTLAGGQATNFGLTGASQGASLGIPQQSVGGL